MVRGGEATVAGHLAVECRARAGEWERPGLFYLAHGLANDIAERTCHAGNRLELRAHTIECGLQRRRALAGLRFALLRTDGPRRLLVPGFGVQRHHSREHAQDRQSVVEGKSVAVRVDLGGRRTIKQKKKQKKY